MFGTGKLHNMIIKENHQKYKRRKNCMGSANKFPQSSGILKDMKRGYG